MTRTQIQPRTDDFPTLLERSKGEIAKVLPEGVNVDRVCRVALTAFKLDDKIRGCTPVSILSAVMKACELGLEPGGAMKHAYLIPYGRECTFQPSYLGLLELARRSGAFEIIEARVIGENDVFELVYDPATHFLHRPNVFNPGATVAAYAYGVLRNGQRPFQVMNLAELEKVRSMSKQGDSGPWRTWRDQMYLKVVLKRFLKTQPLSVQLATAIEADDREIVTASGEIVSRQSIEGPHVSRSKALGQRLQAPEFTAADDSIDDLQDSDSVEPDEPKGREPGEDG